MKTIHVPALAGILLLAAHPCAAESFSIWSSPRKAFEQWRTIRSAPVMTLEQGSPATTLMMTTSNNDRPIWVDIPLTVPRNLLVEQVTVCYQVSDAATAIEQIRLAEMQTPDFTVVMFDDGTTLNSTTPTCYTYDPVPSPQPDLPFPPQGTVTLSLLTDFADLSHSIKVGGIALHGLHLTTDVPTNPRPGRVQLEQNVPNPFSHGTRIDYSLSQAAKVRIGVHDVAGRRLRTFDLGTMPSGTHSLQWNGLDDDGAVVPAGTYFYRLWVDGEVQTRSLTLRR